MKHLSDEIKFLDFFEAATRLRQQGIPFVVVSLVESKGYVPQDPGAKAIIGMDSLLWGTVGGGRVENKAIQFSKTKIEEKRSTPEYLTWNLQRDVGMSCGGELGYLFEYFSDPQWRVAVFGAGHVAQELIRLLIPLKAQLLCIDPRQEWLDRLPKSQKLKTLCLSSYEEGVEGLNLKTDFCVVLTQGHNFDFPILQKILKQEAPPYIGVIGSEIKAKKIKNELLEAGIKKEFVEFLRCPMGLYKGSNDPYEIALSIAAELVQSRDRLAAC